MRSLLTFLVLFFTTSCFADPTQWRPLAAGLDYATVDMPNTLGKLHAFRIDLNKFAINLALPQDSDTFTVNVKRLAEQSDALLAINGGFFSPERVPLGLRIQDGQVRHPLKTTTGWWGVFYIQKQHAYITPPKSFVARPGITFAVQAGPRLLVDGRIPQLKDSFDERSALCITHTGNVIIAATDNAPMSTTQLASILKTTQADGGLDCRDALNLDGGTSTQLYANIGSFYLYIPSFMPIADAIIVKSQAT